MSKLALAKIVEFDNEAAPAFNVLSVSLLYTFVAGSRHERPVVAMVAVEVEDLRGKVVDAHCHAPDVIGVDTACVAVRALRAWGDLDAEGHLEFGAGVFAGVSGEGIAFDVGPLVLGPCFEGGLPLGDGLGAYKIGYGEVVDGWLEVEEGLG